MNLKECKYLLDTLEEKYNNVVFIEDDPISIPHGFTLKQDIEISGFFAAIFAWGQRKTIINKTNELMFLMDEAPYDFIRNYSSSDLDPFKNFVHRTFNFTDLEYLLRFFKAHYAQNDSLEVLFVTNENDLEIGLTNFRNSILALPHEKRTEKHIASPVKNSACKRLNMYLRWMVRKDNRGVDFGIWENISPANLYIPLDVHVMNVAQEFSLLKSSKSDWKTCKLLTHKLKKMCPEDPVKYDFSLFGYGIESKYGK